MVPSSETLDKIRVAINDHPEGLTVSGVALAIGINRNSAARYLDILESNMEITQRVVGPARLYVKGKSIPLPVQLKLFKDAMDAASCGITIADATKPDMPLIYVNQCFIDMTGYERDEVIDNNCRFLQGEATKASDKKKIKSLFEEQRSGTVRIDNYTKDGKHFVNELHLAPIFDDNGVLTHYVGVQTKIE